MELDGRPTYSIAPFETRWSPADTGGIANQDRSRIVAPARRIIEKQGHRTPATAPTAISTVASVAAFAAMPAGKREVIPWVAQPAVPSKTAKTTIPSISPGSGSDCARYQANTARNNYNSD